MVLNEQDKQSWSIIVPCFNEKGTIVEVIDKIRGVMGQIASEFEVTVFDDGSTDGSTEIVKQLADDIPEVQAIIHGVNKGLGSVLRPGYLNARFENVISIPGDGQFDVNELLGVAPIPQSTYVSFYRKENLTYSFFRNKLSYIHKRINKSLIGLNLRDVNWAIAFKTKDLHNLNLELSSTLIKSEICSKLLHIGYQVQEVPSVYHPRVYGEAKGSSFKMIRQAISDTWRLNRSLSRFKKSIHK